MTELGRVIFVNTADAKGREMANDAHGNAHLWIIVSPDLFNRMETPMRVVVPLTSRARRRQQPTREPYEVEVVNRNGGGVWCIYTDEDGANNEKKYYARCAQLCTLDVTAEGRRCASDGQPRRATAQLRRMIQLTIAGMLELRT